jgi:hypothetical protein
MIDVSSLARLERITVSATRSHFTQRSNHMCVSGDSDTPSELLLKARWMRGPLDNYPVSRMHGKPANNVLTDSTVSNGFPHGGYRCYRIKLTQDSVPFLPSLPIGVFVTRERTPNSAQGSHVTIPAQLKYSFRHCLSA